MKSRKKIILWLGGIAIFGIALLVVDCNLIVAWDSKGKNYDYVSQIPHNRVGLLLATSPITPGGAHNFYFDNRIKAAHELYKVGKIDYIIASGVDYTKTQKIGCDEPKSILDSLVARGVPAERIILDYEGTTTRNSIYKAGQIYGLDSVTIISQKDHNERAIFLANLCQIKAVGYNAAPSHIRRNRIKNTLREYLARVKMLGTIIIATTPAYHEDEAVYSKIHQ